MADNNKISPTQGMDEKRYFLDKRKLGELLVEIGALSQNDLQKALGVQKGTGKRLGLVLSEMQLISEYEIAFALAMQVKIPFIDLEDHPIDADVIKFIPKETCKKLLCIPIHKKDGGLHVSMADPFDLNIIKEITFITGLKIYPAISTATQILDRIEKHYHLEKTVSDVAQELARDELLEFFPETEDISPEDEFDELGDSPLVKMVDLIIKNAIKKGASDIHIEAQEKQVRVRNRIDGCLQDTLSLPKSALPIIISRIKVLGSMDIAEKRLPQDGRIKVKAKGFSADLRISTLPTYYGEKAVIRILNKTGTFLTMDKLGFDPENLSTLRKFTNRPQGMILITGPTGSGKTSTLYACVHEIRSDDIKLITVEDPVEYELAGINQVQINEKAGLTFPFILRAILRQDPDVIMIGEIRDLETAEIAVQASLTGHLVLSTLHTNDAPSAITRLLDIGIPPYMITSTVVGVVAQRLLRTICPDCKEPHTPNPEMLSLLNVSHQDAPSGFFRGTGCAQCNNTGFKGRTVIEEIMTMGHKVRELVLSGAGTDSVREAAIANGMTTLAYNGLEKIRSGVTTIEEALKQAYQAEE